MSEVSENICWTFWNFLQSCILQTRNQNHHGLESHHLHVNSTSFWWLFSLIPSLIITKFCFLMWILRTRVSKIFLYLRFQPFTLYSKQKCGLGVTFHWRNCCHTKNVGKAMVNGLFRHARGYFTVKLRIYQSFWKNTPKIIKYFSEFPYWLNHSKKGEHLKCFDLLCCKVMLQSHPIKNKLLKTLAGLCKNQISGINALEMFVGKKLGD